MYITKTYLRERLLICEEELAKLHKKVDELQCKKSGLERYLEERLGAEHRLGNIGLSDPYYHFECSNLLDELAGKLIEDKKKELKK